MSEIQINFEEFKESMAKHQCNSCVKNDKDYPTECNPECMECFANFVEWNVRKKYEDTKNIERS